MPHNFPSYIQEYLDANMPARYELWWARGEIMKIKPTSIEIFSPEREHKGAIVVETIDVDTIGEDLSFIPGQTQTFDLILFKTEHEARVRPTDIISIFGHRVKDTDDVVARYMLNHNTGMFHVAYVDIIDHGSGLLEHPLRDQGKVERWLQCDPLEKRVFNYWWLLGFLFLGQPVLYCLYYPISYGIQLMADTVFKGKQLTTLPNQEIALFIVLSMLIIGITVFPWFYLINRFCFKYERRDLTPIYDAVARAISDCVRNHPDPKFTRHYRGL